MRDLRVMAWLAVLVVAAGVLVAWSGSEVAAADVVKPSRPAAVADVQERPDRVSAMLSARLLKHKVEITGERTENTTTWANPDGSLTTRTYTGPVRFRRGGAWADVDLTLQRNTDGSVGPQAHPEGLRFAGGDQPGARVAASATRDLVTLGTGSTAVMLGWRGGLPAPQLSGTKATYPDAVPGVDLVLEATRTSYESSFILKDGSGLSAAGEIRLPLLSNGVTASGDGSGGLVFSRGGTEVGRMPAPTMWDAQTDPHSGEHPHRAAVGLRAEPQDPGGQGLDVVLTPDPAFLTDPATVLPITVDPIWTETGTGPTFDTYVQNDIANTDESGATELRIGTSNGGGEVARTYMRWPTGYLAGTHVMSATMSLAEFHSYSCTQFGWDTMLVYGWADTGTRWGNQPTGWETTPGQYGWSQQTKGYSSSCAPGWVSTGITPIMQKAADAGVGETTIVVKASSETDSNGWKKFYSSQAGGNVVPYLDVQYNHKPTTGQPSLRESMSPAANPNVTSSVFPTICARLQDGDGGVNVAHYEVWNSDFSKKVDSGDEYADAGGAGSDACHKVGTRLTVGQTYNVQVQSCDGTDCSPWTAVIPQPGHWYVFTVDQTPPPAAAVTATAFVADGWTSTTSGTFSWSDTASDLYGYKYRLDNGAWSAVALTPTTSTQSALATGWHQFTVQAFDKAGNSATTTFSFGVGAGAVSSPKDQDRTQARVTLASVAAADRTHVTYRYRLGTGGSFADIPTGDVTIPGGNTHPSWPLAKGSDGKFQSLTWNIAATVGSSGLVQVEACLGTSASDPSPVCTPANNVQLLGQAFGASYATRTLGPGRLSLLTGDYAVDASDVSVPSYSGSLSIGRVFTTLAPSPNTSGLRGVFGPGWRASFDGPGLGAADLTITDLSTQGYVVMTAPDGGETLYAGPPGGSSFTGQGDANDGSVLTKDSATQFTLTGKDGTKTIWTQDAAGWTVSKVVEAGSNDTTLYSHDTAGRITQFVAPAPINCSTNPLTTLGCRTVTFTYDSGISRLSKVSFTTYDPATSGMRTVDVAQYSYDSSGRLAAAWDPRISPALKVVYTYDSDGRLSTVTPPGLTAWTLHYDSQHRLSSITRPDPSGATATSTVTYDVPFTSTDAPIDLAASQTATWAQTDDLPTVGTAVFDPDHVPASTPTSTDWPYADLAYLDVNGREVNTASYGAGAWQIATTAYDKWGNTTRTLSAGNRAEALNPTADTDPLVTAYSDPAVRAGYLDSQTVYTPDGVDATDSYGPAHPAVLDNGTTVDARAHTHTTYDENRPDSAKTYHLPTTITTTARTLDGTDTDPKTVHNSYDPIVAGDGNGWDLRQVIKTTQVMGSGQADIVRVTRYDTHGQAIETRMPSEAASGTGAGTTKTTYYTATGTGTCAGTPFWIGLVCQTTPAAQPAGKPLPTTTTTYNLYDEPTVVTEQAGTTTRTSTTGYDLAGRPKTQSLVVTPVAEGGSSVPGVTTSYDPATGLPTTLTAGSDTLTTGYDSLGRVNSYTDADHQTSTATYDLDGRPASTGDGKGTQTYTYDGVSGEHRGLLTKLSDSQAGDFTASYDAAGAMTTETFPGGLTSTVSHDNTGAATSLSYAKASVTWLTFTQARDITGQVRTQTGPAGNQTYSYDNAGRLSTVDDQYNPGSSATCTRRSYGYDANSNRLSATTRPGAVSGTGCDYTSGSDTTLTHSYDTADRISDTGYAYDNLGRTISVPATAVAGGADLSIGYYADDMVASQTEGTHTLSFTLDPARRLYSQTDSGTGVTETNHYDSSGDSPSWSTKSDGTWQRFIGAIGGDLAAQIDSTGTVTLQLTNLHGDVIATCDTGATGITAYHEQTEFGIPRDPDQNGIRYAWLGAAQRSGDGLGGLILMGARLYNPTSGRFLQPDPVPGGSANNYDYTNQDPINNRDLDGRMVFEELGAGHEGPCDSSCLNVIAKAFPQKKSQNKNHKKAKATAGVGIFIAPALRNSSKSFRQYGFKKANGNYLKRVGIDAEVEKAEIYGPHGSRYDLYVKKGYVFSGPKSGYGEFIYTGLRIVNGEAVEVSTGAMEKEFMREIAVEEAEEEGEH